VGFFPLDKALELPEQRWSGGVVRRVVWLSAKFSYGDAEEVIAEEGELSISKSTIWQLVQRWGKRIGEEVAEEEVQEKAKAREWSTPQGQLPVGKQGISIDGGMMYILGEGWKEFKISCSFDVEAETRLEKRHGDYAEFGHAENISYTATLKQASSFGWQVWTEAQRRGWQQAQEHLVIGDGASWIWNLRDEHFPESETLVDWYHASEHLGIAKKALYPEVSTQASQWYNRMELALFQGHASRVAHALTQACDTQEDEDSAEVLRKAAHYFSNNQRRMLYQDMRDRGWPIGSGMVESGVKQFKHRFSGPGMRWSRQGAHHLLPVRAAVMTSKSRFDDLWLRAIQNSPKF